MNEHVTDLIPAYALGALETGEAQRVEAHVATCAACQAELRACREAAGALAFAVQQVTPPARLKARVMAATGAARNTRPQGFWARIMAAFERRSPGLALASLALAALLLIASVTMALALSRASRLAGEFTVVAMAGTDKAPKANGLMVISGEGRDGTLVVDGLQPLDERQQYQLWLLKDEAPSAPRVSGGVFSVDAQGYGALVVKAPGKLSDFMSFGITVEPAGGSPGPTGDKVLGGSR